MRHLHVAESARVAPLRGLVLAGGHSRRLGRDKAAVVLAGEPMLSRAVRVVNAVVAQVYVSVRGDQRHDELRKRFPLIVDRYQNIGPAAGMLSAHEHDPEAAWLVVACDMPDLDAITLTWLAQHRDPRRDATAFRSPLDGLPEPLCAIYEPATLARFRHHVAQDGYPGARAWLGAVDTQLLDLPAVDALANVNTPDDLARLEAKTRRQGSSQT